MYARLIYVQDLMTLGIHNIDTNIKKALQKAASTQTSFITADEMGAPIIYGGKIYGAEMDDPGHP